MVKNSSIGNSSFPHRSAMIALAIAAAAAIAIIESTAASEWIDRTGVIHLIGIVFVMVAVFMSVRLKSVFVDEFGPFLNRLIAALAILGFSHAVEYAVDMKGWVDEKFMSLFVAGFYTIALAIMITAAALLMRLAGDRVRLMRAIAAAGILSSIAIVITAFLMTKTSDDALEPLFAAAFIVLSTVASFAIKYIARIGKRFVILLSISRFINTAVILIVLSGLVELVSLFLTNKLSPPKWFYENLSHYIFYASLTVLSLAVDLPNHFSGIFADMRNVLAEKSKAPPSK